MSEVKIYKLSSDGFDEVSRDQVDYESDDDLFLVDLSDYETLEKRLQELEDAINIVKLFDPFQGGVGIHTDEEFRAVEQSEILIDQAIANSRARRKG